jgi:hypothetical protein
VIENDPLGAVLVANLQEEKAVKGQEDIDN